METYMLWVRHKKKKKKKKKKKPQTKKKKQPELDPYQTVPVPRL